MPYAHHFGPQAPQPAVGRTNMLLGEARVRQKNGRRQYPDVLAGPLGAAVNTAPAVLNTGSRSCLEDATARPRDLTTGPCTAV